LNLQEEHPSATDGKPTKPKTELAESYALVHGMCLVFFFAFVCVQPILIELSKVGGATIPYIASTVTMMEGLSSCILGFGVSRTLPTPRLMLRYMPVGALRAIGDTLAIVALNYMDPSLFSVIAQGRIVFAASVSGLVLKKTPTSVEWMGVGVISLSLVEYAIGDFGRCEPNEGDVTTVEGKQGLGIALAVAHIVFKVMASIYLEKVAKADKELSFFFQSALIATGKVVAAVLGVIAYTKFGGEGDAWLSNGDIFKGWNIFTLVVMICTLGQTWLGNVVTTKFSSITRYITQGLAVPAVYFLQLTIFSGVVAVHHIFDSMLIVLGVYIFADGKNLVRKGDNIFASIAKAANASRRRM